MAWTYTTLTQAIKDYANTSETTFSNNIPNFIQSAEDINNLKGLEVELIFKWNEGDLLLFDS